MALFRVHLLRPGNDLPPCGAFTWEEMDSDPKKVTCPDCCRARLAEIRAKIREQDSTVNKDLLSLTCARCRRVHNGNYEGGVCLVCKKEVCGECSMYEEARRRRECRSCEYKISKGKGTWMSP